MLCCLVVVASLLFLPGYLAQDTDGLSLELASVIFRHGDRSPTGTFPNDKYMESDWPQGYEQLSLTGMAQHHLLGQILRNRYVISTNFLNENYTRVQVYVRSTDVDRTLMSAEAQLSGLFPPNPDQQFNENILWQPIPIHTVAKDQDLLLQAYHTDCPAYERLLETDQTTSEYQKIEAENQEFFKYLTDKSGYDVVNLTGVGHLQDVLYIENITDGKDAPSWLTPHNLTQLNKLADIVMWFRFNSVAKLRIAAGHWLQKVLWDMKGKINGTLDDAKLFLYSAHDTTVAAMMNALGVWNKKKPPYATAFFVELYSDNNRNYYVMLFWREGPLSEEVQQLNATINLTIEDFERYVIPLIPSDWNQECDISSTKQNSQDIYIAVALGVLSFLLVIALVVTIITLRLVCCCCKKSRVHYQPLNSEVTS